MVVLKLLGAVILVIASSLIGFQVARMYRDRPRHLRALIRALTQLQAEIEYQGVPLPVALEHVALRSSKPCSEFFQAVSESLKQDGASVTESFRRGLEKLQAESAIWAVDCEAVNLFAQSLATMDREHLQTQFGLTVDSLRQAESEAREQGLRNARMWQYLGVLTGVMLVILLY